MTTTTTNRRLQSWNATLALLVFLGAAAPGAAADLSYGYFRTLEGYANLIQASSDSRVDLEVNYPVLAGDRVELPTGSLVEAVLADDTYVRISGDTELVFDRLALSGDTEDETTLLRLLRGELQLEVQRSDDLELEPLRVDTVNATVYFPSSGSYRIASDGHEWTEVVARSGYAEITTERGSALVRSDEQVIIEGDRWARVSVRAAPPRDALERWGEDLLLAAREGYSDELEPELGYAAAPLSGNGAWIETGNRRAWRPHVRVGWRPYHDGWWHYTPSGLTWIAHEPWGWVTHHYGSWDYLDPFGWVWYPGYAYTPASVYWYWGPSHIAWVPLGYYSSYYHRYPPRFGVYGWAGGYSGLWTTWTFCPTYALGRRDSRVYHRTGAQLTRSGELREVPRGIITTDTRPLTPDRWKRPTEASAALKAAGVRQGKVDRAGNLPDVSDFVARKRELSNATTRAISAGPSEPALGRSPVTRMKTAPADTYRRDAARTGPRGETARRMTDWAEGKRPADSTRGQDRGRSEISKPGVTGGSKGVDTRYRDLKRPSAGSARPEAKPESSTWRDRTILRRPSTTRPESKGLERATGTSSGNTPPVRRVLEGVRLYRERSRSDSARPTSPSTKDYSRPSSSDRGSSTSKRPSGSGSYRKPSSTSGSSRPSSSTRSSGGSGSKPSARSSGSGRSSSGSTRSGSSRSGSTRSKSSGRSSGSRSSGGRSSGGAKRRGG